MPNVDFEPDAFPRWLRQADECKAAALVLSENSREHSAFWIQQALERVLKAFLVKRGVRFENNITDLNALVEMCGRTDPAFLNVASSNVLRQISAWETAFQYPPEPGEPEPVLPTFDELNVAYGVFERLRELVTGDVK